MSSSPPSDKLTIDANSCLDPSLPSCNSKNLQLNLKIINELDLMDLNFIEKDLDYYEKVSVIYFFFLSNGINNCFSSVYLGVNNFFNMWL